MRRQKVTFRRAEEAAKGLLGLLAPLGEALFPSRGGCPSCGREAQWMESLPGSGALCLECRRALMGLFRWEGGPKGKGPFNGGPCIRGRLVQCGSLSPGLDSALEKGGATILGQAALAMASIMPLDAYFSVEGVYAQAGPSSGAGARLSPFARALASACEADFLGIVPSRGAPAAVLQGSASGRRGKAMAPGCALVVMQGGFSRQAEEEAASRLTGTKRIICAYMGIFSQGGGATVI